MRGCLMIVSHKSSTSLSKLKWIQELSNFDIDYVIITGDPLLPQPTYNAETHTAVLPCRDDYIGLPDKIKAGFQYVEQTFNPSFVCKVDDDILLNTQRFIEWQAATKSTRYDYVGKIVHAYETIYCGGPMYYVSRKALLALQDMDTTFHTAEDICVGNWLAKTCKTGITWCFPLYTDFIEEKDIHIAYHDRDNHLV